MDFEKNQLALSGERNKTLSGGASNSEEGSAVGVILGVIFGIILLAALTGYFLHIRKQRLN